MRDDLEGAALGDRHAVSIRSRDGLVQPAYLTLPPGSDRDGDGRPDAPLPMVLLVHGGPWQRSQFAYHPIAMLLANRGYATLSPNFRGSTGFGKAYVSAGDGEWGAKMQDDLVDAAEWAVSQGIAERNKVAIYGGSYGGYAVLAALAFTPEKFACGVDLFGPSNLVTQVESDAARSEARRAEYYRRVGDPTTQTGRAFLTERSPIVRADAISRPLLVAQGANDPQVKKPQSDQIVEALRSRGAAVTYLLFPDEGHGFTRPENEIALTAITEHFLAQCLGGRAEPFGESLRSSSLTIPYGAHFVEGLQEALAKSPAAETLQLVHQ
jgi:dipeptidyl aminopeptidase/acylaminoacyl peptidase